MSETTTAVLDVQCSRCKDRKATYRTEAECRNCGWRGEAVHSLTHTKTDSDRSSCPRCECRTVFMGAFVEDPSDA